MIKSLNKQELIKIKAEILDVVTPKDSKTFIVGGAIRDMLDGMPINDIDIVSDKPDTLVSKLEAFCKRENLTFKTHIQTKVTDVCMSIPRSFLVNLGDLDENQVYEVKLEISPYQKNEEITGGERDFMCNAIHWKCGGPNELMYPEWMSMSPYLAKQHILIPRRVDSFDNNPVRIFRAADLMCRQVSYTPNANTYLMIADTILKFKEGDLDIDDYGVRVACLQILHKIFKECAEGKREWDKVLNALSFLMNTSAFTLIHPKLMSMSTLNHNSKYHNDTVWHHTLEVMDGVERVWDEEPLWWSKLSPEMRTNIIWAAFLHDIGKVDTESKDKQGYSHFIDHQTAGADWANSLLIPVIGKQNRQLIVNLIRHHMDTKKFNDDHIKPCRYYHIRKLMYDLGSKENMIAFMVLNIADCWASNRPDKSFPAQPEVSRVVSEINQAINDGIEPDWYHYKAPLNGEEIRLQTNCEPQLIRGYLDQIRAIAMKKPESMATKQQAAHYIQALDKSWKTATLAKIKAEKDE